MRDQERTGQILLLIGIFLIIFSDVLTIVLYNVSVGFERYYIQIGRLLISVMLFFFLYKGYVWAKYVVQILYGLGFLAGIVQIASQPIVDILFLVQLLIVMAAGYTISVLAFSPHVKAFLSLQRTRRTEKMAIL